MTDTRESELQSRFANRAAEYSANVHIVQYSALGDSIQGIAGDLTNVAVSRGLPVDWIPDGPVIALEGATPLAREDLLKADAALTGCAVAIADSGTIILDGKALSGRRSLSLLPDWHVCVVLSGQIVCDLAQGLRSIPAGSPTTLISGPSATSDIELSRVEGVHGPRRLDIIIAAQAP